MVKVALLAAALLATALPAAALDEGAGEDELAADEGIAAEREGDGVEPDEEGLPAEEGPVASATLTETTTTTAPSPRPSPPLRGGEGDERTRLSPSDLQAARAAWRYFERNYQPATGLVNSVEGYPSSTEWDLGSSIIATVAARELGLLDAPTFARRVTTVLRTLATKPLFEGALPNKAYDSRTAAMVDYQNRPAPKGIGASALDLGRLASALELLARRHPEHREAVARALARWDGCRLAARGELRGAHLDASGKIQDSQEGRLGYEQYAAHALSRLGLDLSQARRWDRFAVEADVLGVKVQHDARDRRRYGAVDALVTDPFVLDAFEFGETRESAPLLSRLFEVQKRRWARTGLVTAAGEDHVDQAPWFVYGAIWADGKPWQTVTAEGADASAFAGVSAKAAFALATLFPGDPYARVLRAAADAARDGQRGFFAGAYDGGRQNRSMNANTNGIVLEALLFEAMGPLHGAPAAGEGAPGALALGKGGAERCADPPEQAGAGGAAPTLEPPPAATTPGFRIDGTIFGAYRGIDGPTAGGLATIWPWRYFFLRGGGEYTPDSKGNHGTSRFLWGIGYDDWHDNTIYAHVDNWGPIRLHDGLAVDQAEANLGYRVPRWCPASSLCFAPVMGVTAPFAGGPYVNARLSLVVANDWFVMGGIGYTLPGVMEGPFGTPQWRAFYGFGRSTWAPGSLFVTYYDWGPTYRDRNGVVSVGINWGF